MNVRLLIFTEEDLLAYIPGKNTIPIYLKYAILFWACFPMYLVIYFHGLMCDSLLSIQFQINWWTQSCCWKSLASVGTSAWRPRRWPAWPRFARAWRRCAASPTGSPTTFTSGWSCYIFSLVSLQIAVCYLRINHYYYKIENTKLIFPFWPSYLSYQNIMTWTTTPQRNGVNNILSFWFKVYKFSCLSCLKIF